MKIFVVFLSMTMSLFAINQPEMQSNTGISQIYDIMGQLEDKTGAMPPDIQRVAVYRIRVDKDHFSPGMARFIRERVEEVFRRASRREVVTAPELKTIRVDITDSTFQFSNTVPTLEALWDIGKKLRVDGFIDGSCTRTIDGDVLITLKLIRNKTGEIEWSRSFISGPNAEEDFHSPIRVSVTALGAINPVKSYVLDGVAYSDAAILYGYGFGLRIEEATTSSRRFYFGIHTNVRAMNLVPEEEGELRNLTYVNLAVGGDLTLATLRKKHSNADYWLGIRAGMQLDKPLSFSRSILSFKHGYRLNISDHFAIDIGLQVMPFNKTVMDDKDTVSLQMETLGYEFGLFYTF